MKKLKTLVFVKTILTLDDILPLLYQLREQNLIEPPLVIAWDLRSLEYLRRNVLLIDALQQIGGQIRGTNVLVNRWLAQIHNLWVLRGLLFTGHLIFETYPVVNRVSKLLSWINRKFFGGVRIRCSLDNKPRLIARNTIAYYEAVRGNKSVTSTYVSGVDYLVLGHPPHVHEEIHNTRLITNARVVIAGYTKGLPAWREYLDRSSKCYAIKGSKAHYFFFPLSAVGAGFLPGEDSISMTQKLRDSLTVLREYNDRIFTIFKPHFKTDMAIFCRLLNEVGYRNFDISYLHPAILCRDAKFTFSYHPTAVFIDSYFVGCPTVEYASYDSRFYRLNRGRPRYLNAITYFSHGNTEKLREILHSLIVNKVPRLRAPTKVPDEFTVLDHAGVERAFAFLGSRDRSPDSS